MARSGHWWHRSKPEGVHLSPDHQRRLPSQQNRHGPAVARDHLNIGQTGQIFERAFQLSLQARVGRAVVHHGDVVGLDLRGILD